MSVSVERHVNPVLQSTKCVAGVRDCKAWIFGHLLIPWMLLEGSQEFVPLMARKRHRTLQSWHLASMEQIQMGHPQSAIILSGLCRQSLCQVEPGIWRKLAFLLISCLEWHCCHYLINLTFCNIAATILLLQLPIFADHGMWGAKDTFMYDGYNIYLLTS